MVKLMNGHQMGLIRVMCSPLSIPRPLLGERLCSLAENGVCVCVCLSQILNVRVCACVCGRGTPVPLNVTVCVRELERREGGESKGEEKTGIEENERESQLQKPRLISLTGADDKAPGTHFHPAARFDEVNCPAQTLP